MAEGSQERTELPTPRKLRKSRERGDVWQSRDLTSAVLLLAAMLTLMYQAETLWTGARDGARACFELAAAGGVAETSALGVLARVAGLLGLPCLAVVVAAAGAAGVTSFLQVGPLIAGDPLKPRLSKLNPLTGVKRLFFSINTYAEFIKTLLKASAVAVICGSLLWGERVNLLRLSILPPTASARLAWEIGLRMGTHALIFFFGVAALDMVYQRWNYIRQQKMSKEEVKREYKEDEGDPQHKAHRRQMHEEISQGQMLMEIPKAHAVIVNPTHLAIALRYDPDNEQAPRVLAKGQDWFAQRIIEVARREGVPIYRDIPLAHALHELRVSDEIPGALYEAVQQVFQWVDELIRERGETPPWDTSRRESGPELAPGP